MGYYLKLYISVLLFGISMPMLAQNRFSEGESSEYQGGGASYETAVPSEMASTDDGPVTPHDPVPIDDYLPLLLITAVGIIVHAGWRKRKQTA